MIALWVLFICLVILSVIDIAQFVTTIPVVTLGQLATMLALISGAIIVGCHVLGRPLP